MAFRFRKYQVLRFCIQAFFFALATWAILYFWGAAGAHQVCPFTVIETPILAARQCIAPGFFIIGVSLGAFFILLSAVFPRCFCGWVCPIGFISRILRRPGKKLKIYGRIPVKQNHKFGLFAFVVLAYVAVGTAISGRLWCQGGCPFFWGYALWKIPVSALTIVLLSIFIFGSIVIERFFCRWFCPYGAILGLVGRHSIFSIRHNLEIGEDTGIWQVCPMGTLPQQGDTIKGPMCMNCLTCVGSRKNRGFYVGLRRKKD